ncbi:MAG: alanine:cation symporter family protein, partial [Myxococcales bacterium]|nr:alanine:cation symporter family protein [Myxococcales bacterium]
QQTVLFGLAAEEQSAIAKFMSTLVGYVWNWPLIILCVGAGLTFTILTKGVQFRAFGHAIDVIRGKYDHPDDHGEISHFKALTSALSATLGLGNIAGVAVAITAGGPGAVFWMWVIGFLGMSVKFVECTLSMKYRHEFADGHVGGGPMYTIERGLGKGWSWMAILFAVLVTAASFGGGNMFQTNQSTALMEYSFGVDPQITGGVIAGLVAVVIIGGIKRIGTVTSLLVPVMVVAYMGGALLVIFMNAGKIPETFGLIFSNAFSAEPLVGGTLGVVITQGVRRATFSNEAGLGSAAIAHAAAKTKQPVREGIVASLGPFIDTVVVCTITALLIIITGQYDLSGTEGMSSTLQGSVVTARAFDSTIDGFGTYFLPFAVLMFSISTVISWSYYGEKGVEYLARRLAGDGAIKGAVTLYRGLFCVAAYIGAVRGLDVVLNFSDAMLGLQAVPNLIACFMLLPVILKITKTYFKSLEAGEFKVYK